MGDDLAETFGWELIPQRTIGGGRPPTENPEMGSEIWHKTTVLLLTP